MTEILTPLALILLQVTNLLCRAQYYYNPAYTYVNAAELNPISYNGYNYHTEEASSVAASKAMLHQVLEETLQSSDQNALDKLIDKVAYERDEEQKSSLILRGGQVPGAFSFIGKPSETLLSQLANYGVSCAFYLDPSALVNLSKKESNTNTIRESIHALTKKGHIVGLYVDSLYDLGDMTASNAHQVILSAFKEFRKALGWTPQLVRLPIKGYTAADAEYCTNELGLVVTQESYVADTPDDISSLLDSCDPSTDSPVVLLRGKKLSAESGLSFAIKAFTSRGFTLMDYSSITGTSSFSRPLDGALKQSNALSGDSAGMNILSLNEQSEDEEKYAGPGKGAIVLTGPAKKIIPKAETLAANSANSVRAISIGGLLIVVALVS